MIRGTKGNLLSPPLCRAFVSYDRDSLQAPVVQKVDSLIDWINHYSVDNAIGLCTTYQLDSDLSGG